MQWCMTEPNHTPKFIIAHYSVVKTDKSLVYIAQLDLYLFTKTINMFKVGTGKPLFSKLSYSGGVGGVDAEARNY